MKRLSLVSLVVLLTMSLNAEAKMGFLKKFKAAYPKATSISECALCHTNEDDYALNGFGEAAGAANFDFKAIEAQDSDGDGLSNIAEINAGTFPGDGASKSLILDNLTAEELEDIANYLNQ